jgi:hypothetical protein
MTRVLAVAARVERMAQHPEWLLLWRMSAFMRAMGKCAPD